MRLASVVRWSARSAAGLLLAALVVVPASAGPSANTAVLPPNSKPYGHSYAEWSAMHWQWEYSMPVDQHPLFDTADCSEGQSGKVWFLGGTFASTEAVPGVIVGQVTRECTIPAGTSLFFPLVDVECSTIELNGDTEGELRDCANLFADLIDPDSLFLTIDGKVVKNLADYRVESPLFTFGPLPDNNILQSFGYDAPEGSTSPSVSDGVFVMLKPLSVGEHTIHFGGVVDLSSIGGPTFVQDITYVITVAKKR
jgi:hypothetical protein